MVCACHAPIRGRRKQGDQWWKRKTPANPLVRCVSCNTGWRNVDLDLKISTQKQREMIEHLLWFFLCLEMSSQHKKKLKKKKRLQ
jgi:hypothetical protein